jgi:hypothetical protein
VHAGLVDTLRSVDAIVQLEGSFIKSEKPSNACSKTLITFACAQAPASRISPHFLLPKVAHPPLQVVQDSMKLEPGTLLGEC